jgi:secreted PhoX family phosphatase
MAHHPVDDCNLSETEHFQDVLERSRLSRRQLIQGGLGLAGAASIPFLGMSEALADGKPGKNEKPGKKKEMLNFDAVAKSLEDQIQLPPGYSFTVLHATGDRISDAVSDYSNLGVETDDWSQRVGDHHDGMEIFHFDQRGRYTERETRRAVLAVNHESSADAHFFHANGQTSNGVSGKKFNQFPTSTGGWDLGIRPESEVLKEINHHGVSLVEVEQGRDGRWSYLVDSKLNRRVTAQTPMRIAGPAKHMADLRQFMVTKYDPSGKTSRGTINNCGSGKTPWGTYLACEENWAVYFYMPNGSVDVDAKTKLSRQRYGVINAPFTRPNGAGGQGWSAVASKATDDRFGRWDVSAPGANATQDFRNEPNTFGFNVEIDPLNPHAVPAKRVAMGRFAHEAAVCSIPVRGKPLAFYMGCDSQNEYIYKFVTKAVWDPRDEGRGMAAGDKYLNEGTLYVAKFNDDGSGVWIELSLANVTALNPGYAYAFANEADVMVNTRHAATAVGATRMDRPEWGALNPKNGEVYFTMTNNSSRTVANTDGANPRAYADDDGRTRSGNPNGHIIRFRELGSAPTATKFTWDIFLFGAEEDAGAGINLSELTDMNDFSSPDGLWFSPTTGICWIQTDDGAYTDVTNCMLLAAIPGEVGDGEMITVNNTLGGASGTETTFIGATLGEARLRRFLVGPRGCEVTGMTETDRGRTLFVNIQHPGENTPAVGTGSYAFESQWPGNEKTAGYGPIGRPRSATIVITRDDGGVIGR